MSAGIQEYDWMMSGNKIKPWHGIGTVVEGCPTSDEAIRLAKLDWDVLQEPVVMSNGNEVPNTFINYRSDIMQPLGIVKKSYTIQQNRDSFAFLDEIIKNTQGVEAHYETAGSLFNGAKVFMTIRLPNTKILDDDTEHYLYFLNSHDASYPFTAGVTSVRVVCNNTLQMALSNSIRSWKCRHTVSIEYKKQEAARQLGLAINYIDAMQKEALTMASKQIKDKLFIESLFNELKAKNLVSSETSFAKLTDRIFQVRETKEDLENFRYTNWGIYNAVADVLSNQKPLRETKTYNENKCIRAFVDEPVLLAAEKILMAA